MLIKYLEGLKPLKITAQKNKFSFSYNSHAKAESDIKLNTYRWEIERLRHQLGREKMLFSPKMEVLQHNRYVNS